jgi:hypothetical protein
MRRNRASNAADTRRPENTNEPKISDAMHIIDIKR